MSTLVANTLQARTAGVAVTTTKGLNVGGACTSTSFVGPLTGNVTGDVTGTASNATQAEALTGTPDITVRNVTGVAATFTGVLTYEDVTNVDSVGMVTARGGLEIGAAGVGGTITSQGNAIFVGVTTVGTGLTFADNIEARFGNAGDLKILHDGSNSRIKDTGTGALKLSGSEVVLENAATTQTLATFAEGGAATIYHADAIKLNTLTTGVKVTGLTSTTSFTVGPGVIQEKQYTVASALTGTVNMDVVTNGLVQYYSTNASAAFVVNLRGDGSTTLNSLMDIGQSTVFTLYHASNNTSYRMTDFQIDGSSITEKWNGGAPTEATGSGTDSYVFNILKTADATFTVFANFSNFA